MKKLSLLLLMFTFLANVNAQDYIPFPKDTAQWSVRSIYAPPYPDPSTMGTVHLNIKGDTIINNLKYSKVYKTANEDYYAPNQLIKCFIREDTAKKVFVKYPDNSNDFIDTAEFVLYDFGLNVGDTFTTKMLNINGNIQPLKFNMVSIDSTNTNNGYRRIHKLNIIQTTEDVPVYNCFDTAFYFIEGIGSNIGPFYIEMLKDCNLIGIGVDYDLLCFQTNFNYIIGGTNCHQVTDIEEVENMEEFISAMPLPAKDQVTFKYKLPKNTKNAFLNIYDVMGRVISNNSIDIGKEELDISTAELNNGIYFYGLSLDGKLGAVKKMIVIK
jgi:hypothetical protein